MRKCPPPSFFQRISEKDVCTPCLTKDRCWCSADTAFQNKWNFASLRLCFPHFSVRMITTILRVVLQESSPGVFATCVGVCVCVSWRVLSKLKVTWRLAHYIINSSSQTVEKLGTKILSSSLPRQLSFCIAFNRLIIREFWNAIARGGFPPDDGSGWNVTSEVCVCADQVNLKVPCLVWTFCPHIQKMSDHE